MEQVAGDGVLVRVVGGVRVVGAVDRVVMDGDGDGHGVGRVVMDGGGDVGDVGEGRVSVDADGPIGEALVGEVTDAAGVGPAELWHAPSASASVAAMVMVRRQDVRLVMVPPTPLHRLPSGARHRCARPDSRHILTRSPPGVEDGRVGYCRSARED
ncbi:hypothetical protein GCM10009868_12230 [Terrabacter aerolatus]|uniref:Uncharacterized protein n=1 Tax=Terrabacter aerolatus TaxID=422442 RepID=A0A512CXZ1_9MICO|nr:hypothetical protein TAE01_08890 [Terrabacter aerolatus]